MITLNNIKSDQGSRKKAKRVWRWNASWKWTYCWRGMNGQNCRSGWWVPQWFEWGQTPLFRRMPKLRWFSNARFKIEYNVLNLSDIEILAAKWITEITKEVLLENRVIRKKSIWVKLLGSWELKSKVSITVDKASETATKAITDAWGKIELV